MPRARSSLWRHLLVWCLALLLPLQGLAAGVGLHCAVMAASSSATQATPPCHAEANTTEGTTQHTAAAVAGDLPTDNAHGCSACAACCIATALPSHSRWAPAAEPAPTHPSATQAHRASVTAAGLDRPPKPTIA
jgi:hypothetical protein